MDLAKQKISMIMGKLESISSDYEKTILLKLNQLNTDLDVILYYINDIQSTVDIAHNLTTKNNKQSIDILKKFENKNDGDCWSGNCMWLN